VRPIIGLYMMIRKLLEIDLISIPKISKNSKVIPEIAEKVRLAVKR
jgi:hypothetical protein